MNSSQKDKEWNKRANSLVKEDKPANGGTGNDGMHFSPLEIEHKEESKHGPRSANNISSESYSYSSSSSEEDYKDSKDDGEVGGDNHDRRSFNRK